MSEREVAGDTKMKACSHYNSINIEKIRYQLTESVVVPTLLKVCRQCDVKLTKQLKDLTPEHRRLLVA
jgi:hypothetical protein